MEGLIEELAPYFIGFFVGFMVGIAYVLIHYVLLLKRTRRRSGGPN